MGPPLCPPRNLCLSIPRHLCPSDAGPFFIYFHTIFPFIGGSHIYVCVLPFKCPIPSRHNRSNFRPRGGGGEWATTGRKAWPGLSNMIGEHRNYFLPAHISWSPRCLCFLTTFSFTGEFRITWVHICMCMCECMYMYIFIYLITCMGIHTFMYITHICLHMYM